MSKSDGKMDFKGIFWIEVVVGIWGFDLLKEKNEVWSVI